MGDEARDQQIHSLDTAAVMIHELFMSYVRAGFTEEQAMRLILAQFPVKSGE